MTETTETTAEDRCKQGRSMQLLTRVEVRERLGNISDDKFYGLIREGSLPRPIKLGTSSRWLESEVETFIARLVGARQALSAPPGIRRHHEKLAAKRRRGAMNGNESSTCEEAKP